jgi:hypothetical protein
MQDETPPTLTTLRLLGRVGAVFICLALFVLFWGSFFVAENDAYCCGHAGYVHQPWGMLGYAVAVILGFPLMMLATKLWDGWR